MAWLEWAPWVVGLLGAALLIVGAVLFLRSRREEGGRRRMRHQPGERPETPGAQTIDASTVFCHSCGTPAGVSDTFCRKCGTRLRV